MKRLNAYLFAYKEKKLAIYLAFYIIIAAVGMFLINEGNVKEKSILLSLGIGFIGVSMGVFFFLAYDYLESRRGFLKALLKIIGVISMICVFIAHFYVDITKQHLFLETIFLRCDFKNIFKAGLILFSYVYCLFVRKIYRITIKNYFSEDKKLLIQFLLPIICYIISLFFLLIGLTITIILIMGHFVVDYKNQQNEIIMFNNYKGDQKFKNEKLYEEMKKRGKQKI
ncbi:MAG: hypothetical protein IJX78_02490 [Bacilli bacterium]|nr:hypothetical protein [Bacilli bacterium]